MTREHYDLIVIGAGSAARDGARKAMTEHGARVALVEHRRWGGSCPNVACTPTKAYLVAAEVAHRINTLAPTIGIQAGPATTYPATATFVDPHTIRAGDVELTADRILIATGSRTAVPPIDGIEDVDWLDHVSALELTELPKSMLVVGAGAVGLEFGQIFARFGSEVTIVDALGQVAPRSDTQAASALQAALEAEGIPILLESFVKSVVQEDDGLRISIAVGMGGEMRELRAERILLASGRVPNVEELNLEAAGVHAQRLGITVDEHMRTNVP